MAYYKSPEDMFSRRAKQAKASADRHWAMAKNGQGGYHYTQARDSYDYAAVNQAQANKAKESGATFSKKR